PASGEVRLGDARLRDLSAKTRAKALGYLPQGSDIAWDVSVESLVALGRHPHGDGGRGARGNAGRIAIEAAIAATAIEGLRHRPASQLSGGERARTLLARVLAGEPDWVLADEPLAALDLAHQLSMIAHLRGCAQGRQGVVIVLHDLGLAMNHADRVLVLQNGRLVADGPPEEALAAPVIQQVWGITSRWLGEPGARALVTEAGLPTTGAPPN
ncbi:MAG: ABC transporter ATP-binding protein, partial [Erythrobacter sp.]